MKKIENVALISAAGSGKTHALTKRFLFLFLHKNNYPLESLYAITFTNAAAYEMKSRILKYLNVLITGYATNEQEKDVLVYFNEVLADKKIGEIASLRREYLLNNLSNLNVSTFHSMFATFLSVIPFQAGILPECRIIDESEEEIYLQQAIDKYFEQAHNNKETTQSLMELIQLAEQRVKESISRVYHEFNSYMSLLLKLFTQGDLLNQRAEICKTALIENFKAFKDFVNSNIEATHTKAGAVENNWKGFLDGIEKFIDKADYESLVWLLEYFVGSKGMEKDYFVKFRERLENPADYKKIVKSITDSIIAYLEALSNKEMIIMARPFVEIYRIFQEEKKKKNVISFSDIEDCILYAFEKNQEMDYLYFKLGADINHLMIDEFQDTSYKQIDILTPILDEITAYNPEEKSLFYVGDPYQAIFRWRGGAPELFDELKSKYEEKISTGRLDINHRTKAEIIEFVNKVLDKNDKPDPRNRGGWLRIEELGEFRADEGNEAAMLRVIDIIKDLKKYGYQEGDIAILTRENDFAAQMASILSENGISCLSRSHTSILDEPDVQLVIHLLKFLDNPENDFSLFMVLTSDLFRMSEEIIRSIKGKGKNLFLALCNARSDWSITKKLKKLLSLVYYMNPYQFIFNICNELGIKISYPLATLLDAAIEYMNDGCGSLADFIEWLEHYGPAIEVKETQFEGVRIMTIHKAKGLEFEIVIIPETNWDRSGNKGKLLISSYSENARPDNIYLRKYGRYLPGLTDKEKELECNDDLNLLYVALTRAKTGIHILGYKRKRGNSGFWFERIKEKFAGKSLPYDEIPERRFVIPEKKRIERIYSPVMQKPLKLREERDLYSPTERGIEIIEPARRRGMEFGDIVHKALSKIFWLDGLDIEKAMNEVIDNTKRNWVKNSEDVEEIEIRLRKILRDTLTDPDLHFIFYRDTQNKECKNELDLYYEKEKSDVSAHLDRIIIEPQRITIIDYKIGKEKKEYLSQMRDYKQGISIIFQNREIITYLLFLEESRGNKFRQVL